ncbi:1,3-beta-galactosyl-N-acetylhexosamine phosphorylase C-terminal domain-containing protein, partial [Bifidobacterium bifidum]
DVTLLRADGGQVQLAVNEYGKGRGVYVSGLPYSAANARLLERILFWASHNEDKYTAYSSTNPECEVAVFPDAGQYCVINNTDRPQSTDVALPDGSVEHFDLDQSAIAWRNL